MFKCPLGKTGADVSILGYGAMALSIPGKPEDESLRVIQEVIDAGVTFFDTADTYCRDPDELHHNERLLAKALNHEQKADNPIVIATKGGTVRTPRGWEVDGHPDFLYRAIRQSYEALGGQDPIPLWQHHWPDPRYSIRDMMGAVKRAVGDGLVKWVGVGNYSIEQIKEAREVLEVVSVQNQFNFWRREAEHEGIIRYCEQEDLVFLPWRPMGGFGLAQKLREIEPLAKLARKHEVSPQRIVIAWQLSKSKAMLPIPGSSQLENILDCLAAADLRLEEQELRILDLITEKDLPQRARPAAWRQMPPLTATSPSG